jgi:murein DD-endopeptidase MepM/ murein hydrolase activator NlpD
MRESLQETGEQYAARYQALRIALIDFYLGSGTVDAQQVDLSQLFGLADASTQNLYQFHTGIDSINGPLTELLAAWSGRVERSSWSDLIGNVVDVRAGYSFEGDFLSAGFSYGNAHLMDRIASEGQLVDFGALLGHSGNTGSQVVGQNGGYHNHFTIFDPGYGMNRYLSSILGLGDSSAWLNTGGTSWTYQYEPHDRRYYDPERIYTAWFRK